MYQESHEQGIGYSLMICIHIHNDMPIMSLISMRNGFNARMPAARCIDGLNKGL